MNINIIKRVAFIICILLNFPLYSQSPSVSSSPSQTSSLNLTLNSGRNEVKMTFQGRVRTAVVYVPVKVAIPSKGWPVVMMLHGAGGSTDNVIDATGWAVMGEENGFVSIFPNGTPRDESKEESFARNPQTWNSGVGFSLSSGNKSSEAKNVDDVGYLSALLKVVQTSIKTDSAQVFVCGHSNGAGMAYRFALERSDIIAAVGVMAGHFLDTKDTLKKPVSLIQIVGDQDPFTPIAGGEAGVLGVKTIVPPVIDAPTRWAKLLHLSEIKVIEDSDKFKITQWKTVDSKREVKSIIVKGHGHGYLYLGKRQLPKVLIGPTVNSLNATETFWVFFQAHNK